MAESVHILGQYREEADRVASEVLAGCAGVLEERERRGGKEEGKVGMRSVLRGLSRVLER